eukprot:gene6663-6887_t
MSSELVEFQWLKHWYPVHVLDFIDASRPHAIELLGKQLVLWKLAPLSEGRVTADGTLQCSYHGWRFGADGRCVDIPQAVDAKAKATACSSARSCAVRFPTREECGLIWVWPTAGAAAEAEAAAAPLPLSKAVQAAWRPGGTGTKWFRRELEFSYLSLAENLLDPAHVPFAHHHLTPSMDRSQGGPMTFVNITSSIADAYSPEAATAPPDYCHPDKPPLAAFQYKTEGVPGPAASRMAFTPPCSTTIEYELSPQIKMQSELLCIPRGPGRVLGQQIYQEHLVANKLFDMDNVFISMQDRLLARQGTTTWVRSYYMPTPSDGAVIAGRRWLDEALQLPLDPSLPDSPPAASVIAPDPAEVATSAKPPTQQQVNNRYEQHTKHCTICQQAMQMLQSQLKVAQAAAAALLAAAVGLVAGGAVPQALRARAGEAGACMWGMVGAAAAVLAASVVAAALAADIKRRLEEFVFVEFAHADND